MRIDRIKLVTELTKQMKHRCNNSNDKRYEQYGGRGIRVCSEWQDAFKAFYDWAIKNGYAEFYSWLH